MNYSKSDLIATSKSLYGEIDECISKLLSARTNHDLSAEGEALFQIETLMVNTMQHLSCVVDFLSSITERHIEGLKWIKRTGISTQPIPYYEYCNELLKILENGQV